MAAKPAQNKLSILMAASEAAPFAKTGGLADVSGALSAALAGMGHTVNLFMPLYKSIDRSGLKFAKSRKELKIPVSARIEPAVIHSAKLGKVNIRFIEHDRYFGRDELYNTTEGDYPDNAERFAFFSRAVLEAARTIKPRPDIIHLNDWQTALIPAYVKTTYANDPTIGKFATLLTIHNLGYQGQFPPDQWHLLGLDWSLFNPDCMEFHGAINFLKGGITFSDIITTVSRTYAEEIKGAEQGWGLDGVLRGRADKLFGIVNGIDTTEWNPKTDPHISANYSAQDMAGKSACKTALIKELGLEPGKEPVLAIITRLADQKGIDLIVDAMDRIMALGVKFVMLGSGQAEYENFFKKLMAKHRGKACAHIGFDEKLAHRIMAGADMFLMPSRYEPCGLTQMYSLAYGAAPIVRTTGGLNDTVHDFDLASGAGNGFKFDEYSVDALFEKVKTACELYRSERPNWNKMVINGIGEDHSWKGSAREYVKLYKKAIKERAKP